MKLLSLIASVALLLSFAAAAPCEAMTIPDSCKDLPIASLGDWPKMHTKLDEENEQVNVWLDRHVNYLAVNFYGSNPVELELTQTKESTAYGAVYSTRGLKAQAGIVYSTTVYTGIESTKAAFKETDPDKIRDKLFEAGVLPLEEGETIYDYVIAETDTKHWGIYRHSTYGEHAYTVSWNDKTVFYDRAGNPLAIYQQIDDDLFDSNMSATASVVKWEKNGTTGKWYVSQVTVSYADSRIISVSAHYLPDKFQSLIRVVATYYIGNTTYMVQYGTESGFSNLKFQVAYASNDYGFYRNAANAAKVDTDWYNISGKDWYPVRDFSLVPLSTLTFTRLR